MAYLKAGPIKVFEIDDKNKVDNDPHLIVKEIKHQGHTYYGQSLYNMKQGVGRLYGNSGTIYEGQYANDRRHGFGRLITSDGSVFMGMWKQDLKEGPGIMLTSDGQIKEGTWLNGIF